MTPPVIQRWIDIIDSDPSGGRIDELDGLLDEDAVLLLPGGVHSAGGPSKTAIYLRAAAKLWWTRTSATWGMGGGSVRRCWSSPPRSTASTSTAST